MPAEPTAPRPTPADVAKDIQAIASSLYPGLELSVELRVRLPNGNETVIFGIDAKALSDRQTDILQALEEAGPGARLVAESLAKLAGYECDSRFRADLSALKKLGRLVNHSPGYSLVE